MDEPGYAFAEVIKMLIEILFFIYAAAIPLVPLYGVSHYKKSGDPKRKAACAALFALQLALSALSIIKRFGIV